MDIWYPKVTRWDYDTVVLRPACHGWSRANVTPNKRNRRMKLYYAPGVCSLAPHILAQEAGIPLTYEKVDLKAKRTESGRDYLQVTAKGYVPALELADCEVLT